MALHTTVASDDDASVGYMLAVEGQPTDPDALLGGPHEIALFAWI